MEKPDILFIVLDTQRADRLGCYGYAKGTTPHLDHFAQQGAQFAMGIAPAQWTIPSHASMFTGLYPSLHQVTQSSHTLRWHYPHIAEQLREVGYETVAFCNNPLVGVLQNGFQRGFEQFFNYGGAAPNPFRLYSEPKPLQKVGQKIGRVFRQFANPIQNFFGHSELAFRLSLNAWVTPVWSRIANFKGQNERSVRHLGQFLQQRETQPQKRPLFLFLNLMETHLPFRPPQVFLDRFAPYLRQDKKAMAEMQRWNREAYRWAAPLAEPLAPLEAQLLSDLYDAEVAYQDHYLGRLLTVLSQRANAENTLTIIVGDHGDGLGEHNYVGHAFNAYQELIHVPLILHWPRFIEAQQRITTAVSTRRVYHTMLDAGVGFALAPEQSAELSLINVLDRDDRENGHAFAEIYPPLNFVHALSHRQPELLKRYRCDALRRAAVDERWKLVQVDAQEEELFDLSADPVELQNRLSDYQPHPPLQAPLAHFSQTMSHTPPPPSDEQITLQDKALIQQLRHLGYLE